MQDRMQAMGFNAQQPAPGARRAQDEHNSRVFSLLHPMIAITGKIGALASSPATLSVPSVKA
ncbi:MAG TPA: hypothetical protein DEF45_26180 [Rhodopirellula sp.]|nr:hypothetical protein [Rhodopirellula sp.]